MDLRWHPQSEEHILTAHGVTWDELEQANTPPVVSRPGTAENTVKILGRTDEGRYLAIIVRPDDDPHTAFVITARDMSSAEQRFYRRRERKG